MLGRAGMWAVIQVGPRPIRFNIMSRHVITRLRSGGAERYERCKSEQANDNILSDESAKIYVVGVFRVKEKIIAGTFSDKALTKPWGEYPHGDQNRQSDENRDALISGHSSDPGSILTKKFSYSIKIETASRRGRMARGGSMSLLLIIGDGTNTH